MVHNFGRYLKEQCVYLWGPKMFPSPRVRKCSSRGVRFCCFVCHWLKVPFHVCMWRHRSSIVDVSCASGLFTFQKIQTAWTSFVQLLSKTLQHFCQISWLVYWLPYSIYIEWFYSELLCIMCRRGSTKYPWVERCVSHRLTSQPGLCVQGQLKCIPSSALVAV